jgi:hypothetical protein
MELKLIRTKSTKQSTSGTLSIDGKFECFTLEDPVRDKKIAAKTAIPAGTYIVDITHSNRFKKKMPILLSVPGFTGIRIHSGNTAADTEGCILVGKQKSDDRISESRTAYNALFDKLEKAKTSGSKITILIVDTHSLLFNGKHLFWLRNGQVYQTWPAVSGRPGYQTKISQSLKDKGPIPEGIWNVRHRRYQVMPSRNWIQKVLAELGMTAWPGGESAWGRQRVWLEPSKKTQTYGRSGFSIHGGDTPGSAGCIDLVGKMPDFAATFVAHADDLKLSVKYSG